MDKTANQNDNRKSLQTVSTLAAEILLKETLTEGGPFDETGGMKEDFKRFKGKCTLLVKGRTQIAHTLFDLESRLKRFNESKVFLLALKSHLRISSLN